MLCRRECEHNPLWDNLADHERDAPLLHWQSVHIADGRGTDHQASASAKLFLASLGSTVGDYDSVEGQLGRRVKGNGNRFSHFESKKSQYGID